MFLHRKPKVTRSICNPPRSVERGCGEGGRRDLGDTVDDNHFHGEHPPLGAGVVFVSSQDNIGDIELGAFSPGHSLDECADGSFFLKQLYRRIMILILMISTLVRYRRSVLMKDRSGIISNATNV